MSSFRFDVAVLGGGAAGCVLAARLSENADRQVCLVEAGPDYGPYDAGRWPADLLDARHVALSHAWPTDRDDRSQLRARVIGGCSAHNVCIAIRGVPSDYDEWPGWGNSMIEPYLDRAEQMLGVREFGHDGIAPWHRAWLAAAREAGLGGGANRVNARGSIRWQAAFAYLDPARDRPNLTIRPETLVERVEPERSRVVTSRGTLDADVIVVCGGPYGSPGILLRSAIGPGLELDLPVGEQLSDQVGVGFSWAPTERLVEDTRAFEMDHPLFAPQESLWTEAQETFILPWIEWNDAGELGASCVVFVMKPHSRGHVSANGPAAETPLRIEHGFLTDDRDRDAVLKGMELVRELASGVPYLAGELRPGAETDLGVYLAANVRGFFHPVGTCGIGRVVEPDGRVKGVDGLYVADASIMPTIPRANTHVSTIAVAERLAELL